jgi:CRP-like cAMP-binding protein
MTSSDKIIEFINRTVKLTDEEALQFSSCFKEVKIKKRQFIIQPGFIAKHRYYIVSGAFRSYVVTNDGQDCTISFGYSPLTF